MNAVASKARETSPYRTFDRPLASEASVDPASLFGAVLLFVTSLLRLVQPFEGLEEFGAEPTLALMVTALCGAHLFTTARAWLRRRKVGTRR